MNSSKRQSTYEIDYVVGWWSTEIAVDRRGIPQSETFVCAPLQHKAPLESGDVVNIRPITRQDRDVPLGPREEEGIPAIHPHAKTVIETIHGDKLYVTDDLDTLAHLNPTPETLASLTQAQQLIMAVADLNPRAVELPLRAGFTVAGTILRKTYS